jgi:hypothetical protein
VGNGNTWISIQKEEDVAAIAWLICGLGEAFKDAYAV